MDRWRIRLLLLALLPLVAKAGKVCCDAFGAGDDSGVALHWFWGHVDVGSAVLWHLLLVAAAVLAVVWRQRPASRRVLLAGWGAAFVLTFLPAVVPWPWRFVIDPADAGEVREMIQSAAPLVAFYGLIDHAMVVPSLTIGLTRAGLALVRHRGDSPIGGLFVAISGLLLGSLLLIVYSTLQPLLPHRLFMVGLDALVLHCGVSVVCGYWMALPHRNHQWPRRLLTLSADTLLLGGLLAVGFATFRLEILDKPLFARPHQEGWLGPVDVIWTAVGVVGRGLVTAVVFGDLIVRSLPPVPAAPAAALADA